MPNVIGQKQGTGMKKLLFYARSLADRLHWFVISLFTCKEIQERNNIEWLHTRLHPSLNFLDMS